MHIFVNQQRCLTQFLEHMVRQTADATPVLYNTLLELYLKQVRVRCLGPCGGRGMVTHSLTAARPGRPRGPARQASGASNQENVAAPTRQSTPSGLPKPVHIWGCLRSWCAWFRAHAL